MSDLYRIHWKNISGTVGYSTRQMTHKTALNIANEFNRMSDALITYWVEPVPTTTDAETPADKESTDN